MAGDPESGQTPGAWIEAWRSRFELLFSALKIVALMVSAGWTYYQWDKTIFPRESHEDFARRASRRTDLDVKVSKLDFTPTDAGTVAVSGVLAIENTKDFPVSLRFSPRPRLELGEVSSLEPGKTGIPAMKWADVMEIAPSEAFGVIDEAHPLAIEPKGRAELAFSFPLQGPASMAQRPFRLRLRLELKAIDPRTGEEIAGSVKNKQAMVQGLLGKWVSPSQAGSPASASVGGPAKQITSWGFGPPR